MKKQEEEEFLNNVGDRGDILKLTTSQASRTFGWYTGITHARPNAASTLRKGCSALLGDGSRSSGRLSWALIGRRLFKSEPDTFGFLFRQCGAAYTEHTTRPFCLAVSTGLVNLSDSTSDAQVGGYFTLKNIMWCKILSLVVFSSSSYYSVVLCPSPHPLRYI